MRTIGVIALILGGIAAMAGVILVVGFFVVMDFMGSGPTDFQSRSDSALIQKFETRRGEFEKLATLFQEDSAVTRVDPDGGNELPISAARWRMYKNLMDALEIHGGIRSCGSGCILFISTLSGNATTRTELKGYVHHPHHPRLVVSSLDSLGKAEGRRDAYRKLDDEWYLHLSTHD